MWRSQSYLHSGTLGCRGRVWVWMYLHLLMGRCWPLGIVNNNPLRQEGILQTVEVHFYQQCCSVMARGSLVEVITVAVWQATQNLTADRTCWSRIGNQTSSEEELLPFSCSQRMKDTQECWIMLICRTGMIKCYTFGIGMWTDTV